LVLERALDYASWNANGRRVRWDIRKYDGVGTDRTVVADRYIPQDARAAANVYPILDGRDSKKLAPRSDSEGCIMPDVNLISNGPSMEHNSTVMPDPNPAAELHAIR
jgi:hypothetical protein